MTTVVTNGCEASERLGADPAPLEWFLFFQAEDGIRDVAVTGVQTCALPIFLAYCSCFFSATYRSSARRSSSFSSPFPPSSLKTAARQASAIDRKSVV